MRIALLLLDSVFDTGLSAILDTFAMANMLSSQQGGSGRSKKPFVVTRIGMRRRITTGQGLVVPLDPFPRTAPELVLIPALGAMSPAAIDQKLASTEAADCCDAVASWRQRGATIAAACTSTFLLASTGLIDDKPATTTWWLAPAFRERFPNVKLDDSRMVVDASGLVTAGAALAHLDLALWIVRRVSPELARTTARHLTFDLRPMQGAFILPDHRAHSDPIVLDFEKWCRKHLAEFSLEKAARAAGVSERTLERRVHHSLGKSPLSFVRDIRVETAMFELETTNRSIDEIAARVGYQDGVTLRTLLKKKTGMGVRELRARGE
jgi:transcriptional regulator GlxA family with amidase domain